jgi:acetyltransferase
VVGLGGTLAEVLDDVAIRLAPITLEEARSMLADLRGAAILGGVRGRPGADVEAVAALIVGLGQSLIDHPEWLEVEGNPVVVGASGALVVDALVVLRDLAAQGLRG